MFKVCFHSVYISQKSCFSLWTRNSPLTCRCNFSSQCSEINVYQSPASKFFHKKRHSSEFFTKNDNSVKKSVKFSVKKIYQFYVYGNVMKKKKAKLDRAEQ